MICTTQRKTNRKSNCIQRISRLRNAVGVSAILISLYAGTSARAEGPIPTALLVVSGASASLPAPSFGGTGANGVLSSFDALTGSQTDVLFGRSDGNTYTLSWKNARINSETIVYDGHTLQRDVDYTLDYTGGALQFVRRLPAGAMVRVTYFVDTSNAVRNLPAIPHLLPYDLWQSGDNHLRFRTLFREEADANAPFKPDTPQFGINALQWTGSARLLNSPVASALLDTKLFVDLQGGDWLDRGGLLLSERSRWGKTDLGVTYSRGGAQFTQAQESGIAAGLQSLEAKVATSAVPGVAITGSVKQSEQIAVPTASAVNSAAASSALPTVTPSETNASVALELAALHKTKVSAALNDRYDKDGAHRTREAQIQLPTFAAGKTQISGGVQTANAAAQERTIGLLSANSKPLRYLDVTGDARLRDGLLADQKPDPNALNTYGLKLNYAPSKRLKLSGGVTFNPEQDGAVKRAQRNALGLESDWGLFAFRGQLGLDQDLTASRATDASELGLDLRISRFDTFTTGFRGANIFDRSTSGLNTYMLGYTRRMGALLDLSLNGSLSRATNSTGDTTKPEIKTEAKLGLHF